MGGKRLPCVVERHGNDTLYVFPEEIRVGPAAALTLFEV
jgi:hypothetical protein